MQKAQFHSTELVQQGTATALLQCCLLQRSELAVSASAEGG